MKKYVLPVILFAAIGAVVIVLVKSKERDRPPGEPDAPKAVDTREEPSRPDRPTVLSPRDTPTSVSDHRWLSELERSLQREDLSHALFFRHKVVTDLDDILESELLTGNLLALIRKYGLESKDPRRRDVVLPILRMLDHPEAKALIEQAYYGALNDEERLAMIQAMSRPANDQETASVWASDMALNGETKEIRARAYEGFLQYSKDERIQFNTAKTIFEGTTDRPQALDTLTLLASLANLPESRQFAREKLRNPRPDELAIIAEAMVHWGEEADAAALEALAAEYPAMAIVLRDRVREMRRLIRQRRLDEEGGEPVDEPEEPPQPPDDR